MTAVYRIVCFTALLPVCHAIPAYADPMDLPDIHTQTLQEYSTLGDIAAEMKIRRSAYLDSLTGELNRLYIDVQDELTSAPHLLERFRESHETFLTYVYGWSAFLEDVQWYDLDTGEPMFGAGYGYTGIQITAALFWERILLYRAFADGGLSGGFGESTVPSDRIGGY